MAKGSLVLKRNCLGFESEPGCVEFKLITLGSIHLATVHQCLNPWVRSPIHLATVHQCLNPWVRSSIHLATVHQCLVHRSAFQEYALKKKTILLIIIMCYAIALLYNLWDFKCLFLRLQHQFTRPGRDPDLHLHPRVSQGALPSAHLWAAVSTDDTTLHGIRFSPVRHVRLVR